MAEPDAAPPLSRAPRRRQWVLVALIVAAGCVNYIDRSTLSIANHDIAHELHLSPGQMGGDSGIDPERGRFARRRARAPGDRLTVQSSGAFTLAFQVCAVASGLSYALVRRNAYDGLATVVS